VIALFHRFVQEGRLEGLLIDVADYAHVPDGPGVILVGYDVDYAIDRAEGRAGLLTTRKRIGEAPLAGILRDTLRKALVAIRAVEADGSAGLRFATDAVALRFPDRLVTPNTAEAFEAVRGEIAPVLAELFGDAKHEIRRDHAGDARATLAAIVVAQEAAPADALIERLGSAPRPTPESQSVERQSDWDISVEELARLRQEGADIVLIDVREPREYEICNLGGELIPLGSLGRRLGSLDRRAHVVVHCHTGGRGAQAVVALREAGFDDAWNLNGGILAWIDRIDSSLTRY
jgi:rhodanese-related sulfurtransferase